MPWKRPMTALSGTWAIRHIHTRFSPAAAKRCSRSASSAVWRLPAPQRVGVRHLWRGTFEHLHFRCPGDGAGRTYPRRGAPGLRGDRRWRPVRRDGLRGPGACWPCGCQSAGDPQRQRDVDLRECRRHGQLPGADPDQQALHQHARRRQEGAVASPGAWSWPDAPKST